MKRIIALTIMLGTTAVPSLAQGTSDADTKEGFSLIEEGARMLMRGIMTGIDPAIDELRGTFDEMGPAFAEFVREVGPAFAELLNHVDDLRHYNAPEILPNGDIIMRRKEDAPLLEPDPDTGEITL